MNLSPRTFLFFAPLLVAPAVLTMPGQDPQIALGNCKPPVDQKGIMLFDPSPMAEADGTDEVVRLNIVVSRYKDATKIVEVINDGAGGTNLPLRPYRTYRVKVVYPSGGTMPTASLVSVKENGDDANTLIPSFSSVPGFPSIPGEDPGVTFVNTEPMTGALLLIQYSGWLTTVKLRDIV